MKVLVLGAGVVGVTTAYYLNRAGHDVTVLDRCEGAGLETSFANGGQIAAAHSEPWASPATPFKALKWMGKKDAPLLFHWLRADPALWGWAFQFLKNCTEARTEVNTERTLRVAMHSRNCLKELRREVELSYDHREEGIIHFYRDEKEFDQATAAARVMEKYGLDREVFTPDQVVAKEAALSGIKDELVGGIYSHNDESGDAHKFTRRLAEICKAKGVEFLFNHSVEKINVEKGRVSSIQTDKGAFKSDKTVVCMGSFARALLKPLGVNLAIYPAKGYSVTLELDHPEKAPTVSLTDDEFKLVFSRLGDRLRIAGTAELGGYSTDLNLDRANFILSKALELFPGCATSADPIFWAGLRPKTPDSVPILGESGIDSLYLNSGHGTLGWTMSCGCADVIADLISGNAPKIALDGLGLKRF